MFYVLQSSIRDQDAAIRLQPQALDGASASEFYSTGAIENGAADIDFVDDALLNVAPHNPIERQLLTGDMVGLALMSGAIIWSAMGAIA